MAACYVFCGRLLLYAVRIYVVLISLNTIFCNEVNDLDALNHSGYEDDQDDYIHNLTVKVIYNTHEEMLQYHISWQMASPEFVDVTVNSSEPECRVIAPEHVNGTEVMIPEYNDGYSILLHNCSYEIVVNDSSGHFVSLNHTIPICVDNVCDCDKMKVQRNLTVKQERNGIFLVQWIFSDSDDAKMNKDITFSLSKPNHDCNQPPSSREIVQPKHEFVTNSSARIYSNTTFPVCLLVNFTNIHNCYDLYVRNLTVEDEPPVDSHWINISTTIALVILLLVVIAFWYIDKCRGTVKGLLISRVLNRHRRSSASNIYGNVTNRAKRIETNLLYVEQEIVEGLTDTYELPRNHLELLYEIGKGAFGEVFLGKAFINGKEMRVAVKTLSEKSSNEEMEDFLSEIDVMKKVGRHPNIVTMLKSCTLQEPYMMVMEYLPFGDLKHYLVNLRETWNNKKNGTANHYNGSAPYIVPNIPDSPHSPQVKKTRPSTSTEYTNLSVTPTSLDDFTFDLDQVLDHTELQNFAFQIASGMAHLEKIPITHRDLAARNILIDENKVLKISDFGLSRPGPYINKRHNKLPLRWMALEAIEDHLYDNKSDVWSFGIVLWEIGTLGAFPYGDVPDRMLIYYLQMGKRLPRPEICTDELYTLMLRCWSANPDLRPAFCELVQQLDVTKSRIYIDFTQLNPTYVFPPTKAEHKAKIKQEQDHAPKYLECRP